MNHTSRPRRKSDPEKVETALASTETHLDVDQNGDKYWR
jgi:hypothetical protein